jgi:TctA family transporter
MRITAALVIAAAFIYAFTLDATAWEYGELLMFGLFGIACKVFGWNRLILILSFNDSPFLEEHMRRAMLISRGDLTAFLSRPISAVLLLVVCSIVAAVALSWTRRSLFRSGAAC